MPDATEYGITLEEAIVLVVDAECDENPHLARMDPADLMDLVRTQVGIGNTSEIRYWVSTGTVTKRLGDAYKAVLCATDMEIARAA
jgi:hypothetical protein